MKPEFEFLQEQGVSPSLIDAVEKFSEKYEVKEEVRARVVKPMIPFYGREILEMAISGLLEGENLLLTGLHFREAVL